MERFMYSSLVKEMDTAMLYVLVQQFSCQIKTAKIDNVFD